MQHVRRFLAPKWIAGHLLVVAAAVTMVFLGRWQLDVSNAKHFSLQNFGYALQWWAFTIFGLIMWVKVLRDVARSDDDDDPQARSTNAPTDAPVAYRSYRMPQSSTAPAAAVDETHAAYNAYLASLAGQIEKAEQ